MSYTIKDNIIYFVRAGEEVRLSAAGKDSIRFQASPNGKIIEQNYTLMPQKQEGKAWVEEDYAVLETGKMRA